MTKQEEKTLKSLATQIKSELKKDGINLSDYDVDTQKKLIIAYVAPAMDTINKITDKLLTNTQAMQAMKNIIFNALAA